ncbi:MAG: DUF3787 domain-containing protein [Peptoniphilaceae bacterium]|nr:DUF3787 domain-containing protein [Peptoniphilaceae bacterium]MCI6659763.1 DUF3787 domain-containing protein [Peptoniphilaceae bacterium]MDD7433919.1 DUF3787 domain-containing protein [Peptoniphilaceae bacterium]MDY3075396.1 DUF3787 domain-containing protein [Peptoniphilaceae bacterium]MDY3986569.1 DUF3787 domain-containing protein [Peptoniphilaceae bacterium]
MSKEKEIRAKVDEEREKKECAPASDVYGSIESQDAAGVETPTQQAVEDAKEWVDEENRM